MDFKEYQDKAKEFANYPLIGDTPFAYLGWGLAGEAGEVCDKIKKVFRDKGGVIDAADRGAILLELGDVLWYVSEIARQLDTSLDFVAKANIEKLTDRKIRGVLGGNGDHR